MDFTYSIDLTVSQSAVSNEIRSNPAVRLLPSMQKPALTEGGVFFTGGTNKKKPLTRIL